MFDLENYPDILSHIQNNSGIYKRVSNGNWIQVYCPFCDDGTRISAKKQDHGHFYISRFYNFCHCFRCDVKLSIPRYLKEIDFKNLDLLSSIFSKNDTNYIYSSESKTKVYNLINKNIENIEFIKYINLRLLGNIDIDKFKIFPNESGENLWCEFYNYYDEFSAARKISGTSNIRYLKKEESKFYFFQNPFEYNNITICEGPFDIINLYNYSNKFNNNCFFSINGKSYISSILKIISEFYITNDKLHIHILFDSDLKKFEIKRIIYKLNIKCNELNKNCILHYFIANKSKDISEIMSFEKVVLSGTNFR